MEYKGQRINRSGVCRLGLGRGSMTLTPRAVWGTGRDSHGVTSCCWHKLPSAPTAASYCALLANYHRALRYWFSITESILFIDPIPNCSSFLWTYYFIVMITFRVSSVLSVIGIYDQISRRTCVCSLISLKPSLCRDVTNVYMIFE